MQFWDAVKFGFKNFVNFRGVVARSTFWWWMAFVALVQAAVYLIISMSAEIVQFSTVLAFVLQFSTLLPSALNIPTLALSVRRLRDAALSPLLLLILLAPYLLMLTGAVAGAVTSSGLSDEERLDTLIMWLIPAAIALVIVATLYVVAMSRPSRSAQPFAKL